MIDTLKQLEQEMAVAKTNGMGSTAIKSVMDTNGVETFTLITGVRYAKNEKIDPVVAKEYLALQKGNLARVDWNKTSTDIFIKVK